ncbi:MAG: hypothetical protein IPK32_13085 [Verrucomicrobiaceae bacterium]|nr:hypothetical protein [Verrucomicrobiaceae bacterium]
MKQTLLALTALAFTLPAAANPELANIVTQEFGAATADGIVLLQSAPSVGEPTQWNVFARDPFRPAELVSAALSLQGRSWSVKPAGAGRNILKRIPGQVINFGRVRYRSADVREIVARAASQSNTVFSSLEYQLAVDVAGGSPEWGVVLLNAANVEVGFIVVNAETGALGMQQWANQIPVNIPGQPENKGARAAQGVKEAGRKAWNWTDNARRETGNFFKELFRR